MFAHTEWSKKKKGFIQIQGLRRVAWLITTKLTVLNKVYPNRFLARETHMHSFFNFHIPSIFLAIISQALKLLSIHVWFLELFSFSTLCFLWTSKHWITCKLYLHFRSSHWLPVWLFFHTCSWFWLVYHHSPPPAHTSNYAIFGRGTLHIHFASASLSYLAVRSHLSILLNVCINSCYVCVFAPMPCATWMESAIHCIIAQLGTHTHKATNIVLFDKFLVVPSHVCMFFVC